MGYRIYYNNSPVGNRCTGDYSVLDKLVMQFMSHSPVRCPSATYLRLIRS
jgi:hypothetical protein